MFFFLEVWRFEGIILFASGWDVGQSSILGKFTVSFYKFEFAWDLGVRNPHFPLNPRMVSEKKKEIIILFMSVIDCGGVFEENDNITASIGGSDTGINVNCLFLLKSSVTNSLAFRLENYSQFTTTCRNDYLQVCHIN